MVASDGWKEGRRDKGAVKPTFGLESKVAKLADVGPDIGVRSDVFLQHAWLLTADATLFTDVLPPSSAAYVNIVFVGLVPVIQTHQIALEWLQAF